MKKICMITHDAPYVDRRILLQAKSLIENGYNVSIIYPFGKANSDFENVGIEYIPINPKINIKNTLSSMKKAVRTVFPQKIYQKLKENYFKYAKNDFIDYKDEFLELAVRQNYDIYVAHDLPALPIAHKAAKIKSAKLVYDAHEFFLGQAALQGKRKEFFEQLENNLISDIDLMFTVNEDIAKLFTKKYNIQNIKILMNSINEQKISKIDIHKKLNLKKSKKIILYQGGFLEDRNLELLVKSASYIDENYVLVMLGYSFLEQKLKNIAKKANTINKKVFFMDRVPQKELLNYTAGADVGIIPYPAVDLNTKYCTPNKMFEFLTANIPMIANAELITVKNIFNLYNIGELISFSDPQTTGYAINNALKKLNIFELKSNLQNAKEILSWKHQEKVLIESYKSL